jgi:Tol biopolymer transport system component/DNA-binding winged helix-turn-helix (wHTH) protein
LSTSSQTPSVVRFGTYEVNLLSGELRKSGIRLKLQDRPFQILAILLEQPGQLVTREQIQKRLWPEDTFVDFEHGLNTAINKLRQALSDDSDNPRFIETLPKRGYRFVAPVSTRNLATLVEPPAVAGSAAKSSPPPAVPEPATGSASGASYAAVAHKHPRHLAYLALLGLGLFAASLVAVWYFGFRVAPSPKWSEIRIAPLNGLPQEGDAAFSPDGNEVAFAWADEKFNYRHLHVSQIGGDSPRRLTNSGNSVFEFAPVWSPDGRYIAFLRYSEAGSDLAVFLISALGGAERRLYTVTSRAKADALDWSTDGKYLALSDAPSSSEASRILLLSLDTLQTQPITSPPAGTLGDSSPAFSPDGKYLAFVRNTLDVQDIFRIPISGGAPQQVTFDHSGIQGIAWSADSRDIIFSSSRRGQPSLWRISAQGGTPQRLPIAGAGWAVRPAISRKGNRLTYTNVQYSSALWRAHLSPDHVASEPLERIISSTGLDEGPQYSPDGKYIVFQSTRTGYHEIWRADPEGSNLMQLTHISGNLTGTPRWSPDSRMIAFDSRPAGHSEIFVINAEGGQPRQITSGDFDCAVPSWSVDGKSVYYSSNRSGSWEVWKSPVDGGPAVQLTHQGGFAALPSADGKYLYYAKGRQTPGLWRVSVEGGDETKVAEGLPSGGWGYVAVVPEGIYFAEVPSHEKAGIYFLDTKTQKQTLTLPIKQSPEVGAPGLAIAPDGRSMLICFSDRTLAYVMLVDNFRY